MQAMFFISCPGYHESRKNIVTVVISEWVPLTETPVMQFSASTMDEYHMRENDERGCSI